MGIRNVEFVFGEAAKMASAMPATRVENCSFEGKTERERGKG